MSDQTRRVWRAGPATLVLVSAFAVVAGVVIPILAYLGSTGTAARSGSRHCFLFLTALALLYVWRFGFHPRLRVTDQSVEIINPFRRYSFEWDDITVIAPGENGLLIGSEDSAAEAWCVQKSNSASRRGRLTPPTGLQTNCSTRCELHDPPVQKETGLRGIRRARLTRAACLPGWNVQRAGRRRHPVFPPSQRPYPATAVARRWQRVLGDRLMHTYLLEVRDSPVGCTSLSTGIRCTTSVSCLITNGADTAPRWWSSRAWRSTPPAPGRRSVGCWSRITPHALAPAVGVRPASGEGRSTRRILNHCR